MAYLQKIMLIGNIGKDPEIKNVSGSNVATCTMAVTRTVKGEKKTVWYNLSAWGHSNEFMMKYIRKGARVYVDGEFAPTEYTARDGSVHTSYDIIVNNIQNLKDADEAPVPQTDTPTPSTSRKASVDASNLPEAKPLSMPAETSGQEDPDDDFPF